MQRILFILLISITANMSRAGNLYLNIIWHQHQPLYVNPETDQLAGPWVRTHATKDYWDMAHLHLQIPEVHATINLTSSLLVQLQEYYVLRLSPFVYRHEDGHRAIDTTGYFEAWRDKTDPWIDLALKPSSSFNDADVAKLLSESWNAFGISDIQIKRFPEYLALRDKARVRRDSLTTEDYTAIKAWFFLAHFDPALLTGAYAIPVGLKDILDYRDGKFYTKRPLTERDANRAVAEAAYICAEVIPSHKAFMYEDSPHLEIITTPFYHPILPLLIDSDIAKTCQPKSELPTRFSYPQDAHAQVVKGIAYYEKLFGRRPNGMWPAEGSISADAAAVFREHGIRWICGDMHVLRRSKPEGLDIAKPYRLRTPAGDIAIVFRETVLSDHIGFTYQKMDPNEAADHFMTEIRKYKPAEYESDKLLTVILDGENAWEWYEKDNFDGREFLGALYQSLTRASLEGEIKCVTPTEYFDGNPLRKIPAHPIEKLDEITELWPGSWINANYDTWIGEPEENKAWEYLRKTREALAKSKLKQPDPRAPMEESAKGAATYLAYEAMYAAEGSDWFWWYGADQSAPAGDRPFEEAFFAHLRAVYRHMRDAGVSVETPAFEPILSAEKIAVQETGGVMQRGTEKRTVRFVCDARGQQVNEAIFIVGNQPELAEWSPNTKRMRDDGAAGDSLAADGLWTFEVELPLGAEIQYKYTNSGVTGVWTPSEEFPHANRAFTVDAQPGSVIVRRDIFGARD